MSGKRKKTVSIRLRIEKDVLKRIDHLAGQNGRQKFITDAINWRLDEELPPVVLELVEEVEGLRNRVQHLESAQSTNVYLGELNDVAENQICRDDLDRRLLAYFLQYEGATTPELAENILGSISKRRTILDRIDRLNERAKQTIGVPVLEHERGILKGKRGAWWLVNQDQITL